MENRFTVSIDKHHEDTLIHMEARHNQRLSQLEEDSTRLLLRLQREECMSTILMTILVVCYLSCLILGKFTPF
jgi:hypothetical protein